MKFTESDIQTRFEKARDEAMELLSRLEVANGRKPEKLRGLTGWIYEQTIRSCLEEELEILGIAPEISEQVRLGKTGAITLDLVVGQVVIEIKYGGFIGSADPEKYRKYREQRTECYNLLQVFQQSEPRPLVGSDVAVNKTLQLATDFQVAQKPGNANEQSGEQNITIGSALQKPTVWKSFS